jgi:cytochrome c553
MNSRAQIHLLLGLILAMGEMGAFYTPVATGQPAIVTLTSGDELKAVYATPQDVAEGKKVAETSCAGCHGANGISAIKGIPNLAGQRPAYVSFELKAYKSGARSVELMTNAVKFMSDDALIKVAAFYATLDPAQPSSTSNAKSTSAQLDPVKAGKAATAVCAGCHGEGGISKLAGTPNLAGLDPKYLVAAMKAYKSGQRKSAVMKPVISAVAEANWDNIALYYALQKPARAQTPAAGDQAAGKATAATCAGCHGDKGVSGNPAIPSLAGQDAQYLATALHAYKDGGRSDETMKGLAAGVDEGAAKNLAAFYANQEPQAPSVRKPLTTAEWAERCDRCHGVNGNSTDPRLPALAGQREDYLAKTLHAYRTGERHSPQMAAMSEVLTEADVENLAAYYAHQKPRAIVYVTVPAK